MARALDPPDAPLAVTGLVLPAELDSEAAALFEELEQLRAGLRPPLRPAWFGSQRRRATPVWKIGAGVNMAFRREAFDLVGGFDERLGAGADRLQRGQRALVPAARARRTASSTSRRRSSSTTTATTSTSVRGQLASYAEGHVGRAVRAVRARPAPRRTCVRALVRLPLFYGQRLAQRPQPTRRCGPR